jgi:hypothetical protein
MLVCLRLADIALIGFERGIFGCGVRAAVKFRLEDNGG